MNNQNNNNIIPIVFTCDDKYIPFLAVSLESMEDNASKNYTYDIKILHSNNISEANQNIIRQKYNNQTFKISFEDISSYVELIASKLHTRDYYSKATYYRLFIPNLYKHYDKVLYLDSDIIVKGDISELYNTELGENFVGAIPDNFVQCTPLAWDYVEKHIPLGKGAHTRYFNAGILLMNCRRLREIDFEGKFIDLLGKVKFEVAQDQDYLNCICRGKVKLINLVWNKQPFPSNTIKEKDIKIFHFNLDLKPWLKDNILYEKHFWEYAKTSGYYDEIMKIKNSVTEESIKLAEQQTQTLCENIVKQANDVVDNARIKKIVDAIFDENESPLVKKDIVACNVDEAEQTDLFDVIDNVVVSNPQKQRG